MFFTRDAYPKELNAQEEIAKLPDIVFRGGSCVVDPYGHYVTQPVWDREEIVYATLDIYMVKASRMVFDVRGDYSRPDVFQLQINQPLY